MKVSFDLFGAPVFDLSDLKKPVESSDNCDDYHSVNRYKFVDLFCGGGAFHLSLEGHECVLASDIMLQIQTIYLANYPGTRYIRDVYTINSDNLPFHDIMCAGFPCQAFSSLGNRHGFQDTRGVLFFEVLRLADIHKTKVLILENVVGLINHDNGRTHSTILSLLHDAGYVVYHKILTGHQYGNIPQTRPRIFMVCFHEKQVANHNDFRFPSPVPLTTRIQDLLISDDKVPAKYWILPCHAQYNSIIEFVRSEGLRPGIIFSRNPKGFTYIKKYNSEVVGTLCKKTGNGQVGNIKSSHWIIMNKEGYFRSIMPREYLNFMGFPQSYKTLDFKDYVISEIAGNSIIVSVLRRLVKCVLKVLDKG